MMMTHDLTHERTIESRRAGQARAVSGCAKYADMSPRGKEDGDKKSQDRDTSDKAAKPKECFCCVTPGRNKIKYEDH